MATKTWNGTADWFTAGDWSGGTLPAATDDDTINSGTASLVSGDSPISANSLTIASGAEFIDSDPATTEAIANGISAAGAFFLQAGATVTAGGPLNITGNGGVDLDPYFIGGSSGGSSLIVGGTLTNSSTNANALDVGNENQNAGAPDTLTVQGVSGNQALFNTGQINVVGSGAGAAATLNIDNAAAVAGFGTAGVETGNILLANFALLEFTAGQLGTIEGTVQIQGPNAFISDASGTTTNSALTGLTSVTGFLNLQSGASDSTTGGLSITGSGAVDLDPYFISGSNGGSSLTVGGTLTNSSTNANALDVGDANQNASAPDTLTVQGVAGNQALFNTGQINIVGSGTGAAATLNIDNAAAVAGFGTAGVETGNVFLANHALLEFTAGQLGTIQGTVQIEGPNAFISDASGTTTNSALTGLTSVTGFLNLQSGASDSTTGGLSITGSGAVDLDPYFISGSNGGSSLTVGGTLTNSSTNANALDVGDANQNASAPDTLTVQGVSGNQALFNTGQINIVGSGTGAAATLNIDNAAAVAGFGTAGVETGNVFLANHALLEFTAGQLGTIEGTVQIEGPNAFIADANGTTTNSALTGLTSVTGFLNLQSGASDSTTGGLSVTGDGLVDLDPYFISGSNGGSSLTVGGTLTNNSTDFNALDVGNADQNASAPDTLTIQGVSGNQGLFNTGQINIVGSGTGAAATLNVDNAAAVAGFGTAGVETGSLFMANDALLEFTAGQFGTIAGTVDLQGPNAFIADANGTTTNSALTGLTMVSGFLDLQAGASVSTTGGLNVTGGGLVDLDPNFISGSNGGSSLTVGGTLTNNSTNFNALDVGNANQNAGAPDTLTIQGVSGSQGLFNTGQVNIVGSGASAQATVNVDNAGAMAGFGTAGVETGSVFLANHALLEFTAGQIGTVAGSLDLQGPNAFVADSTGTTTNSALTGLTSVTGFLDLQAGATVTTIGGVTVSGAGVLAVDPDFVADSVGGTSLSIGGVLTNDGTTGDAVLIGGFNLTSPDLVTATGGLNNAGFLTVVGASSANTATLLADKSATNTGSVAVEQFGHLTASGVDYTQAGGQTQLFINGTLTAPGIDVTGGVLQGDGVAAGTVNNNGGGTVEAISSENSSITNTLTVSGNYNQSGTGVLESIVDTNAAQAADVLNVTGNMVLQGGTLLVMPEVMPMNTLITVATFNPGKLVGEFDALQYGVNGPTGDGSFVNLGNGTALEAFYDNNAGEIQVELVTAAVSPNTYVWDAGGGSWDTAADWNPPNNGTTPSADSDVTIGATNNGSVTLNHDATVNSVTIAAQNTLLSETDLTVGSGASVAASGLLSVKNFNVNVPGALVSDAGEITVNNGTLDSLGTVIVSGSLILNAGVIENTTLAGSGLMESESGTNDTLDDVTISSGSTFTGANNSVTNLEGTIVNAGTIAINGAANDTELRTLPGMTVTLTGTGVVSLANSSDILVRDATDGDGKLVNVNNTIQGAGNIGDAELSLDNQSGGTIDANLATALILQPNGTGYTNEGLLEATAGGTLELDGSSFTQSGGVVEASGTGSTVELVSNTTVNGGTLTTASGGTIETAPAQGSTLNGVTITAGSTFTGANNSITDLEGTIVNNGTIALNGGANSTEFRTEPGATLTLTGSGEVLLSNSGNNLIRDPIDGTGKLINVNNTIQGAGEIGDGQLSLDNQAAGVIDANDAAPLFLQPDSAGYTNEGLLEATAGGTLELDGGNFTQTGGVVEASGTGSTVELVSNTTVNGGTLTTASGGTIETAPAQGSTLNGVTITAGSTFTGANNSITDLEGTIVNNGTIALNGGANSTEFRTEPGATLTLTGSGEVLLSNSGNNLIRDPIDGTGKLINVNNTIQGAGDIGDGQLSLDNQAAGVVDANVTNTLTLQPDSAGDTNEGLLEATAGGTLELDSGTFTQTGGAIAASGANSTVELFNSATVIGGTLTTTSGGTLETATNQIAVLDNVTISSGSTFTGENSSITFLEGTIVNNGTIALDGGANTTELRPAPGATVTLTGGGTVSLSNSGNNLFRDPVDATARLVNVNNTIEGSGTIGDGQMSINNETGGVVDADQTTPLVIEPNSTGVTNAGTFEATNGGTLDVTSALSGGGQIVIGGSSEVELGGASAEGATFTASTGELRVISPLSANYTGTITGFGLNDVLGLGITTVTTAGPGTFNGTTTSLIVNLSSGGPLTYTLAGNYSGDTFSVTHNGGDSDISVVVPTSGTLALSAPSTAVVGVGKAGTITPDISIAESPTTGGETFTVVVSDGAGVLAANTSAINGGGTIAPSNGGKTLTITGTLGQVNADLTTLTDTEPTTAGDTITTSATDSNGGSAGPESTAVTVNGLPTIQAPSSASVTSGVASSVTGFSLSESGTTSSPETFSITLSDINGALSATKSGSATVTPSNGGKTLMISGSLTDVNTTLQSLSDTDSITPSDTITANASDSFGNTATQTMTPVTVSSGTTLSIVAPGTEVVGVSKASPLGGISLSEPGAQSGTVFTVMLSDVNGLLSATASGSASVQGGGTTKMTVSGSLTDVNNTLVSLADTDATTPSDTLTISASDTQSDTAGPTTVAVTVNGLPSIKAPSSATVTSGVASGVTGFSLSESGTTSSPETFSITLSDINGALSATKSGSATLQSSNGGKTLMISGSLTDVNTTLQSLSDTDSITPSDTITANASDSFGNTATQTMTPVTVGSGTTLSIVAPTTEVVGVSKASPLGGISLSEPGAQSGTVFTVMLSDVNGLLSATASGSASVQGGGTTKMTVSGSLTDVNNTLVSLADTDATTPSDTLTITASDTQSDTAGPTTVAVTVNGLPSIKAPSSATVTSGVASGVTGFSLSESGTTSSPETFSITLSDINGALSATKSGSATLQSSNGGKTLMISGSLTDVNNTLQSLSDTDSITPSDTITANASDSFGNTATQTMTPVTVGSGTTLSIVAPGTEVVGVSKASPLGGISLSEPGAQSGTVFTVMLSDKNGLLSATASGSANVQNSGTTKLTVSGSLTDVNNTLLSLADTDATTPSDTLTISASDTQSDTAGPTTVAVTVNGLPSIKAPSSATVTSGVASGVTGFSLSESGTTSSPETFSITLSDINGALSATKSGSATLQSTNGGKTLMISGSLTDVNNTLQSLSDTDSITPSDTITANASDSFGNTATQTMTPVTVGSGTTLSIVAPTTEVVGVSKASPLGGISLSEPGAQSGTVFTVMLSDVNGLLSATASGSASVQGGGTTKMTVSGSLTDVNNTLVSLADTDATTPSDTLTISASDTQSDTAGPTTVAVTVNGAPTVSAPTSVTATLGTPFNFTGPDQVSVAEAGTTGSPETFSVTLSDTSGLLAATKSGSAVVQNSGTTKMTVSGSLTDVDNTLESLTDTDSSSSPDSIMVAATDSFGNSGTADIAVTVNATGQTYTLTKGVDTVNGGPGDNTIVAGNSTLSSGDQINGGGSGDNTLQLTGAGIFNLALPTSLTNVQFVDAQEGQAANGSIPAANQVITLRSGLNVTVNVSAATINPSNPKAPTITVNGANDSSVINLANGNDSVTLGSANETLNGGTGADIISVSAATIGAKITGGTAGSTLEVVGGGSDITMGSSVTNISQVLLLGSPNAMNFIANGISGLVVDDANTGADTVTAGGTGQTLTGGGAGKEIFVGFTGGSTTFQDKTASISGDTITNFFAANSKIDITDMNFATLQTPTFAGGKLTVSDGTHMAVITLTGTEPSGSFTTQQDSGTGTVIGFRPNAVS